jgi:hypothetical protein
MKKITIALLALAVVLAVTPAAMADTFLFTFTTPNNSSILAMGTLTGTNVGGDQWNITSGSIDVGGNATNLVFGSGTLLGGTGSQLLSPSGYFNYDNEVFVPVPSSSPYVDTNGLLFSVKGTEVNIFSGIFNGAPFSGAGTDTYSIFESNGVSNPGELNITDIATPEPSSLLLLGTALFGLAFVVFKKAKAFGPVLQS